MQPTFLPWTGYFALMGEVDAFVFLDDVQFSKQSWQSRNRILGPNGPVILSLPVERKPAKPMIRDARIANLPVKDDLLKRAGGCLGKAPFWPLAEGLLAEALDQAAEGLAATNIAFIRSMSETLGICPELHRSSELGIPPDEKSLRLLSICRSLGADRYLSPVGSADYLSQANPFSEDGIRLRFQTFTPLPYAQGKSEFVSHLSALDALARIGPEALAGLIRAGTGRARRLEDLNEVPQ
jgi:hypothetical protein